MELGVGGRAGIGCWGRCQVARVRSLSLFMAISDEIKAATIAMVEATFVVQLRQNVRGCLLFRDITVTVVIISGSFSYLYVNWGVECHSLFRCLRYRGVCCMEVYYTRSETSALQARTLSWGLYLFAVFICWKNCLLLSFYRTPILHPDWIFKWTHHGRDFYRNCAAAHQAAEEIIRRRRKTLQDKVQAWKHNRYFTTPPLLSREMTSENGCEKGGHKFHTDDVHNSDLGSAFDWLKQIFY